MAQNKDDVSTIRGEEIGTDPCCVDLQKESWVREGSYLWNEQPQARGLYPGQGGGRGHLLLQRESLERAAICTCLKHSSRKHVSNGSTIRGNVAIAKLCLWLAGAVCHWQGPDCSWFWQGFMKLIFGSLFFLVEKKKTWLIIIREEKCACLQTRGLQIAYNSPITVCHQNISAWQDQNYCHPFTFNFNLHEIMFLLLHFFQFFSSPPLFIFPYHFKVNPFSNVIFFCWDVLHLYTFNKGIIFISSLCPLWSHF